VPYLREQFLNAKSARSEAKARIVAKYFHAWAQVVRRAAKLHSGGRLAYIDLFAGPGRYLDGSKSPPLLILEDAVKDADLSQMLISIFNDIDRENTHSLARAIETIPGIGNLKNRPDVYTENNEAVGTKRELGEFWTAAHGTKCRLQASDCR